MMAEWVFWIAVVLVAYTYVIYPVFAVMLARSKPSVASEPCADAPELTVVIAAHNEVGVIAARIADVLAQDYPADRLAVVVVSDGSDDGTEVAASSDDPRVRVLPCSENRGKAAALNTAMAVIDTPLVVFADARQHFAPGAIRALVAAFADPDVGAVSGELVFHDASDEVQAHAGHIGLYWRIEMVMRNAEARLGWLHGVSGSIHAIRRDLYQVLPAGTILDDMAIPLNVVFAGQRVTLTRAARAIDLQSASPREEFGRKLRTLAGNWQLMALYPDLVNPFRNPVFVAWFSHKFLRLVVPWALLAAVAASFVADGLLYRIAFAVQLLGYLAAALALLRPTWVKRLPLASTAGTFVLLNAAAFLSLPAYLLRDPSGLWKKH